MSTFFFRVQSEILKWRFVQTLYSIEKIWKAVEESLIIVFPNFLYIHRIVYIHFDFYMLQKIMLKRKFIHRNENIIFSNHFALHLVTGSMQAKYERVREINSKYFEKFWARARWNLGSMFFFWFLFTNLNGCERIQNILFIIFNFVVYHFNLPTLIGQFVIREKKTELIGILQ